MNWQETVRTGWDAVRSHRLRSGLTMLGILIGIAAVMLTVGLGQGARQTVTSQINALGSNLLVVTPGSTTGTNGVRGGAGSASTLTLADATALASHDVVPDVAAVAPTVQRSESLTAGDTNWTTTVVGTTPDFATVRARTIAQGRFLTADDVTAHAPVVVLGPTTASELFGGGQALGRTVNVAGVPTTVVGVLASAGSSAATNQDDQALLPFTTAADRVIGGSARTAVQAIYMQAATNDALSGAYQEANAELLALHRIGDPADADFTITSQQSILDTANAITGALTAVLGGIAAISLLVGGIGVMNIMLVSVTERIREIGLRKALGATPAVIRRQFLVEAGVLGLAGGVAGAILGGLSAFLLSKAIGQPILVSAPVTIGAIVVAIAIGLVFGVYPASRAARLAPIDALRSE
ncbi:MAG: ABC transporter permease [Pseudonocardia sp.]|uniref:ABC transporter permease n=1 Tax=unclassified Pseudonocardia TaxID=2619320 RepID=UPI00086F25E9|nr:MULTISPECIES: ABC transporter permease [unclassified Pseudonocardia]MBN9110566.1 ABC transporter permease [Pseudonocardia sp.]ODV04299.1 MAG: macrolide ABC transporter permease [Pseudonocardia sp. SCN 73-27]